MTDSPLQISSSAGTQMAILRDVAGDNGRTLRPSGSVGVIVKAPGLIQTNLLTLHDTAKLPYIPEFIESKVHDANQQTPDIADLEFHAREYERLRNELERTMPESDLPEQSTGKTKLNKLPAQPRCSRKNRVTD